MTDRRNGGVHLKDEVAGTMGQDLGHVLDPDGIQDQEDILAHVQDVVPIQDQGDDPLQDPEEEANVVVQEVLQRVVAAVIAEVGAEVTTGREIVLIEA